MADAYFNYSDFASYSYFASAQFLGNALFSDVDFTGATDFSAASFAAMANFFRSRFSSAGFSDAVFSGPAQFGLASFSGLSSFGSALFADEANLQPGPLFRCRLLLGSQFPEGCPLRPDQVPGYRQLPERQFDGDLNFKGGSISTMLLEKAKYRQEFPHYPERHRFCPLQGPLE